jgi:methionine aminopeptidase
VKGKAEKGLAFPTCLSMNHCAGHFSPLLENTSQLQEGDLVKVDLGVHIDGYIAQIAFTWIITADRTSPIKGRAADVVCAAHLAAEAALRLLRPGQMVSEFRRGG